MSAPVADIEKTKLKRGITGPLLFLFIVGDTLGAGIYALMGDLASEVGGALWAPLLLALALALLTAGSYAELVTKYPRAGGASVFAERAYKKPIVSFLVGYCMLAAGVTSPALLSLSFTGDYLGTFIDVPAVPAAIVLLALLALLNARGISESLKGNVAMTLIEIIGLIIVIVAGAVVLFSGTGDPGRTMEFKEGVTPIVGILGATIIAFYSYVGFETSANIAEEVKNPPKVFARALFLSLATAGVVYLLVGLAASITLSPEELAESSGPLLAVVSASGIGVPDWLFSLIALAAVANGALLILIMASRVTYGMAEQGLLPGVLGRVLPKRRTPWVAILVTTAASMVLATIGDISILAETVVLLLLFVFLSSNIAVLVLRREKVEHKHFQVWTPLPYLGIASCLLLLSQQSLQVWLYGAIILAVGVGLYFLAKLGPRSESATGNVATVAPEAPANPDEGKAAQ